MPRYPAPELKDLPEDIRAKVLEVQEKAGFVPNVFLALARRPAEWRAFFAYHDALMLKEEGSLTKGDREMIVTTTSAANQCLYCVVAHGAMLRIYEKKPLVADQVAVNYRKADITPRQHAMLDFAMKVCNAAHAVDDADFERAACARLRRRRHLGHRGHHRVLRPVEPGGQRDGHAAEPGVLSDGPRAQTEAGCRCGRRQERRMSMPPTESSGAAGTNAAAEVAASAAPSSQPVSGAKDGNGEKYRAVDGTPRAAATIVLLRDFDHDVDCNPGNGAGLEVFLVRRHRKSAVLGGAYVFPGGKVDAADGALDAAAHFDAQPAELHAALAEADIDVPTAASIYVAAVREAFEECGVLLAHGLAERAVLDAVASERSGQQSFAELLAAFELRLSTRLIVPWSRWITPTMSVMQKRFDTRFFVAALPAGQIAVHDAHETDESVWITPREALARYWSGEFQLAPPQIMTLAHLARHASVDSVLAAARARRPPLIQPEPFQREDGVRVVCYPGDARHPVREVAMPGPLRLLYQGDRFEPEGGFDALFE